MNRGTPSQVSTALLFIALTGLLSALAYFTAPEIPSHPPYPCEPWIFSWSDSCDPVDGR